MTSQLLEPIACPPSPLHHVPNMSHNLAALSFQKLKQTHQPVNISQQKNQSNFSLIDNKPLNTSKYASVLDSCKCPKLGKQVHAHTIKTGFDADGFVDTKLLQMYARCGLLKDADFLFETMPVRNLHSWKAILSVYLDHGLFEEAFLLFHGLQFDGVELDFFVFPSVFKACSGLVIGGFAQNGYDEEVIEMLFRMQVEGLVPNAQTLASVLPACARLQRLELGKQLHGYITRHDFISNPVVVNALVDVYRRCGDMGSAAKIFFKFSVKNVLSCNTMIVGYCESGEVSKAKGAL
ncbi:hypothetical protein OIU78_017335 [Salix suchowensis]|nr:hypothetical protein OIU78_017335 [Salix suchowensis]